MCVPMRNSLICRGKKDGRMKNPHGKIDTDGGVFFMRKIIPRDTPCYCIRIRRASNALTKFYDRAFEPINLSASQFSLLNAIKLLKACNKSELAAYARLDRTTIIRNLAVLRGRDLIAEEPGKDKRNNLIRLTKPGESAVEKGKILWEKTQEEVKEILGFGSMEDFLRMLEKLESLASSQSPATK